MKRLFCILLLFPTLTFSFPDPYPNLETVDVKHYRFRLELNDTTDIIEGTADISFVLKKGVSEFELDLISKNSLGKGMQVKEVKLKGNETKFSHQNDRLKISLTTQPVAGEMMTLSIRYSGIPQDGLIISKNKFGDRTFFADNWPDRGRNWLPIVDHPADKAAVDFIVIAPQHYEVIANGVRIEESYLTKNQKLTHYKEETPIATKVMVVGVARFAIQQAAVINSIPVESWVYPQNREAGFIDYAVAGKILDFFINHVGPYSYKKLANVQSKTTFGGLENASAIFYFENSVTGKNEHETLIAHEIAHQWFGNSATEKEWHHLWLSEGFATYFAVLYNEFTYGIAKRQEEMIKDRDEVIAFFKKSPMPIVNPAITNLMKLLNVNNYQKGSWVLHMLRQEIGERNFWAGIREYYRQYQNSNALSSDFQQVMETISGKDLDQFFDQWLNKSGYPVLAVDWKYDESGKNIIITVNQTQKGTVFNFPLEIGIYAENSIAPGIERVYINRVTQQLTIPTSSKPVKIGLDPNVNLLFEGVIKN
jgi:aminopeptidase N